MASAPKPVVANEASRRDEAATAAPSLPDSRTGLRRLATRAAMMAVAVAISGIVAEIVVRVADGVPLTALRLPERTQSQTATPAVAPVGDGGEKLAEKYAAKLVERTDVDPAWFKIAPQPLTERVAPESQAVWQPMLEAERAAGAAQHFDHFKLWNANLVWRQWPYFQSFPGLIYVFEPQDGSEHPRYRFVPDSTTPAGLVANRFGFRGRAIELNKPPGTVRIAFLGASTTVEGHGFPFSYPELIEPWLNLWARAVGFKARFEIINAGHEGTASHDFTKFAIEDVLPLEPDILVYYEGSNQFALSTLVQTDRAVRPTSVRAAYHEVETGPAWLEAASPYSAIARRLAVAMRRVSDEGLAEPPKPARRFAFPEGVDEEKPSLDAPNLPLELPTILGDLDRIRQASSAAGAILAPSTFVWLAWEGMTLDPVKNMTLFNYLNSSMWPYRYADIRRAADFQNRVIREYAAARRLPLIDLAAKFPMDPDLFSDPIHQSYAGVKLKAWLVFQSLLPILEPRVASGALPRADRNELSAHPTLGSLRTGAIRFEGGSLPGAKPLGALDLAKLRKAPGGVSLKPGTPWVLETSAQPIYAFQGELPSSTKDGRGLLRIRARMRVTNGAIGVGLTDQANDWLTFGVAAPDAAGEWRTLELIVDERDRSRLHELVLTNANADGEASRVEIDSIAFDELPHPQLEPLPGTEPGTAG